jgi:hypothetical protein
MQLTQFDIDELARQGVDVTGLTEGYPATDDMRIRLGIQDDVDPGALPDPVSAAQVAEGMATTLDPQAAALNAGSMDPAAVAGAMNAVPAAAPVTQEQLTAPKSGGLGDMLFGPQEATDQFSNLNRQQRMMLAFGAIKDAGFALQGKEGNSFASTLKAINDQIDMGRKAKAVEQRQKLLGGLGLRGSGEGIEARRQAILGAAAQGLIDGPTAKLMIDDLQRQSDDKTQISSKMNTVYLIDSLMNNPDLPQILGVEGTLRGVADKLVPGLQETYADLMARVDQLKGGIFQEAFQSLRGGGQITELEGQKASDALARLNTAQGVDAFKEALREYRFYINQGIARLKGENIPLDTFYGGSQPGQISDADLDAKYGGTN